MEYAKRIIVWALIIAAVVLVAVNFNTIRDKVVGFNQNAAYMREAKEAGSKFTSDIFSNWNYDALLPALDDSVRDAWKSPEKSGQFSAWNGTYGSVTQKRANVSLKSGQGSNMDFEYRAEMQCAYKNALLVVIMRRKAENNWKIIDVQVSDLPASAEKFQ